MRHLAPSEARVIHALVIEQFGGAEGQRDPASLEAALAQPSAEYFGRLLHDTVAEQAAAYLFHICQAHAFMDGNKRTAVFCMLVFLHLNGQQLQASDDELFDLVLLVAKGALQKPELAARLEPWLNKIS